jgi:hypothetical protein
VFNKSVPLDKQIEEALESGKKALLASQLPNGSWAGYGKGAQGGMGYPVGPTAIATYALLESGEGAQSDKMKLALSWLATNKATKNYELGLRCNCWLLANGQTKGKYFNNLQDDANTLIKATKDGSYTYETTPNCGLNGDNSNSQYGVLGVWAAARDLRFEVADEYWYKVMEHWTSCQNRDGAWCYGKGQPSSGTMAAAGLASLFICHDKMLASSFIKCTSTGDFGPIQRGLDWFDNNFQAVLDGKQLLTNNVGDIYYYFYGVERVGLASGYKYFGSINWFKLGAERLLATMAPGGGWAGGVGGTDVTTSYALLFLIRGRNAVLFNKLEFGSVGPSGKPVTTDWRCRPRDLALLCNWMGEQHETTLNWQIINLRVPVKEWHDAPIVYISGSVEPKFSPEEIAKLRQFVFQGGSIFSCTECGDATSKFAVGIRQVYQQVLPEYEMVEIPPTHAIYTKKVQNDLKGPKLFMITNGIRPLVIHADEDLPKAWELNQTGTHSDDFKIAENIFMYLSDKGKLRKRGSFTWPDAVNLASPRMAIKIARLKWAGNWNPEPLALERFSRIFSDDQQIDLQVVDHLGDTAPAKDSDRGVALADLGKSGAKLAILSGVGSIKLGDADVEALKAFVDSGGYVLVEAAGGNKDFYDSMETALGKIYGAGAIRSLASTAEVYNLKIPDGKLEEREAVNKERWITKMYFRSKSGIRAGARSGPALRAVMINGKPMIFLSHEDISNAGAVGYQCYDVDGYDPGDSVEGSAYRMLRNIVIYSACGVDGPAGAKTPTTDATPTTAPATKPAETAPAKK